MNVLAIFWWMVKRVAGVLGMRERDVMRGVECGGEVLGGEAVCSAQPQAIEMHLSRQWSEA